MAVFFKLCNLQGQGMAVGLQGQLCAIPACNRSKGKAEILFYYFTVSFVRDVIISNFKKKVKC